MNTFSDDLQEHGPDPLGVVGWVIGGKYKVRSYIGGGGFGEVYEGFNSNLPQQRLVLKFFKEVAFRERFDREAQILCRLDHPNISRVMDYYPDENALVMQYIDGRNTDQILRDKGPLESELFLKIARDVSAAVAFAHKQGVAHRDLKPGNILVDKNGHVYLIDFGIAKETTDIQRTRTGYAALSVNFAAPERQGGRIDYNPYLSDVYELGVTLFNLATHSFPYRNPAAPVFDEWKDGPGKTLAPALRNVLKRATHPDPKRRYQSVEQFSSELKEIDSVYVGGGYSKIGIAVAAVVVIAVAGYFVYPLLFGNKESNLEASRTTESQAQIESPDKTNDSAQLTSQQPLTSTVPPAAVDHNETRSDTAGKSPSIAAPPVQPAVIPSTRPTAADSSATDVGLLSITVDRPSDIYVDNRLRRARTTSWQDTVPIGTHEVRAQHGDDRRQWVSATVDVSKGRTASKSFMIPSIELNSDQSTSPSPKVAPQDSVSSSTAAKSVADPATNSTSVALIDKKSQVVPPLTAIDNNAVIRKTISRFQQALGNADLDKLKAVWPTMSEKEQDAYRASFAAGGMVLSGDVTEIEVSGSIATALFSGTAKPTSKGSRSVPVKFEFTMHRQADDWLIEKIATMK